MAICRDTWHLAGMRAGVQLEMEALLRFGAPGTGERLTHSVLGNTIEK
jgi:hypothetical protein